MKFYFDQCMYVYILYAAASGRGFMARDLTIQNTAGPEGNQSLALRSSSNHTVLYRCELESFQDTLYAENGLQLYLDSVISGTVDFVFGNAKAVFQRCHLLVRRGREGAHNIITAQGRDKPGDDTGFSFQNCSIMAKPASRHSSAARGRTTRTSSSCSRSSTASCTRRAGWSGTRASTSWRRPRPCRTWSSTIRDPDRTPAAASTGRASPWSTLAKLRSTPSTASSTAPSGCPTLSTTSLVSTSSPPSIHICIIYYCYTAYIAS